MWVLGTNPTAKPPIPPGPRSSNFNWTTKTPSIYRTKTLKITPFSSLPLFLCLSFFGMLNTMEEQTGETTQLKALGTLPKDPSSIPSTNIRQLTLPAVAPATGDPTPSPFLDVGRYPQIHA